MATYLYRLGRLSFRRRRLVVTIWLALLALAGVGAATLSGPTSDQFSIPGTESQRAIDLLAERMPQVSVDSATAQVVFTVSGNEQLTDPPLRAAVERSVAALAQAPQVAEVSDPFTEGLSQDGQTAYAQVTYSVQVMELTDEARAALFAAAEPARAAGVNVDFGGEASQEMNHTSATEVVGLAVAAVVLVITFGSLVAAGLPLVTALLGVIAGMAGIQIASGFFDLSSATPTLALMIGLAVGIDYALFIASRYRHELALGRDGEEAAGRAVGTAGSAVVFAGLTVVIALAALSVVGIPFLTVMGVAAAGTVAIAVVVALTLLPALFGFAGSRITGGRLRFGRRGADPEGDEGGPTMGERWGRAVVRRRVPVLLATVVGLGLVALPATDLQLSMTGDAAGTPGSTQRRAYEQLSEAFGPGFNGPLMLVVDAAGSADPQAAAQRVAQGIAAVPDVVQVTPPTFNQAGDTAILTVIPATGPSDPATEDVVHAIRDQAAGIAAATGATVAVTGSTAISIDVSEMLSDAFAPYLAVVVGLAFVLLLLVFRSVLVPLKATLGFLLSVVATFGAVVAVFQWGWLKDLFGVESTGPIISVLPILLIGVLFGLAMDYEVFLVTRMREEHVHGAAPDASVITGFRHGARVVTAAAIIMVSVFAGFVLSDDSMIQSVGFALAFGILVDAFVVRMTLVPAVMSLLGRRAWGLPRPLERLLPDIDVEGKSLERHLDASPDATVPLARRSDSTARAGRAAGAGGVGGEDRSELVRR